MKLHRFALLAASAVILLGAVSFLMAAAPGYHLLKKYSFGPAEGSTREYFDYITVDSAARRIYVSHGTEIKVIDADTGVLIGNISGLKQDHGVAVAGEFGRGFITDGAQGKVIIFDLQTLKVTGQAKADKDADGVIYDPFSKHIFVMNGDPHSSTVIDAKSGNVVGTIDLGGGPEFAVSARVAIPRCSSFWTPTAEKCCNRFPSPQAWMPLPTSLKPDLSSFPRAKAWSTYSTKTPQTNSAKPKPSRPNTAPRPWDWTLRPTTCSWTLRTLRRHQRPLRTARTPSAPPFKAHFTSWSTANDRPVVVQFLVSSKCFYGFVVVVSGYFEIAATSVAPNWNRILPLRFDFKDWLNASLNWSSGYTCSTAAESAPSATRSPSFW